MMGSMVAGSGTLAENLHLETHALGREKDGDRDRETEPERGRQTEREKWECVGF